VVLWKGEYIKICSTNNKVFHAHTHTNTQTRVFAEFFVKKKRKAREALKEKVYGTRDIRSTHSSIRDVLYIHGVHMIHTFFLGVS